LRDRYVPTSWTMSRRNDRSRALLWVAIAVVGVTGVVVWLAYSQLGSTTSDGADGGEKASGDLTYPVLDPVPVGLQFSEIDKFDGELGEQWFQTDYDTDSDSLGTSDGLSGVTVSTSSSSYETLLTEVSDAEATEVAVGDKPGLYFPATADDSNDVPPAIIYGLDSGGIMIVLFDTAIDPETFGLTSMIRLAVTARLSTAGERLLLLLFILRVPT